MKYAAIALLIASALVGAETPDGLSPLLHAVYEDDLQQAKALLTAGADAREANRYSFTALHLACANGNEEMVTLLLEAGADPNATLRGGESAVMTAARTGKAGPVRALLARGANANAKNEHGQTAIMWAAVEGHTEMVDLLVKSGADFRARLESGYTPMMFAVRERHVNVVRTLLKAGVGIDEPITPGAKSGKPLPSRGYRLPRPGYTALNLAIENGHFDLAAFLLENGADPKGGDVGFTPLHQISWVRKTNIGDAHDAVPEPSGRMTSVELVRKLVAHGAGVNAAVTKHIRGLSRLNTLGATPYFTASRTADVELMRTLVELGADPLKPNTDGSTPLMAAAGLGCTAPGEDPGSPEETLAAVALALKHGGDINSVDRNGETAMHGAAYKTLPNVVEFLATNGARIDIWNRTNKQGWTPLMIAEGRRIGNVKPSPETLAALHRAMLAAGIKPESGSR